MADHGQLGRAFLAPRSRTQDPYNRCEIWLSFSTDGGLEGRGKIACRFPPYSPAFASSCTPQQYTALVDELSSLLYKSDWGDCFSVVNFCQLCCVPCFVGGYMRDNVLSGVQKILDSKTKDWAIPPRLHHASCDWLPSTRSIGAHEAARDLAGEILIETYELTDETASHPCWPPTGLSLVLPIPFGDDFRRQWFPAEAVPAPVQQHQMVGFAQPVAQAGVIPATPVGAPQQQAVAPGAGGWGSMQAVR